MIDFVGVLGSMFLATAYFCLNYKKKYFEIINIFATILLLIHAVDIADVIFIVTNVFILLMLVLKLLKEGEK